MYKAVPNLISLSRVLFAVLVVWQVHDGNMKWAAIFAIIGLFSEWLDGMTARWLDAATKVGADQIGPISMLVLSASAVGALVWYGYWSWWSVVLLVVLFGGLQLISWGASGSNPSRTIMRLKRHQRYLHPFFAVILMTVVAGWYIHLAGGSSRELISYTLFVVFFCGLDFNRIKAVVDGTA